MIGLRKRDKLAAELEQAEGNVAALAVESEEHDRDTEALERELAATAERVPEMVERINAARSGAFKLASKIVSMIDDLEAFARDKSAGERELRSIVETAASLWQRVEDVRGRGTPLVTMFERDEASKSIRDALAKLKSFAGSHPSRKDSSVAGVDPKAAKWAWESRIVDRFRKAIEVIETDRKPFGYF